MIQLPPVVGGTMTALGWGTADFIARYTGRALGVLTALFWMLFTSALIVTVAAWLTDRFPRSIVDALLRGDASAALIVLYGLGVTVATLLLYAALARGPVTVAAPIVGSFPAFNLIVALALGTRPSALQWLSIAAVMVGVAAVARFAASSVPSAGRSAHPVRRTALVSLASAALFGFAVAAGQQAGALYGDLESVCAGRWIGVIACAVPLLARGGSKRIAWRWGLLVSAQGALDATAYLTLLLGSESAAAPIAPVIGSTFCVVTVALACLVLRERMTARQTIGVALVVAGVVGLSVA